MLAGSVPFGSYLLNHGANTAIARRTASMLIPRLVKLLRVKIYQENLREPILPIRKSWTSLVLVLVSVVPL